MTEPIPDQPTTEVRYALVLNGGVSLAIWMGGVTHELNNLRMASLPSLDGEDGVRAVWRTILEATHSRVAIDLVAGTSAGGLNGSLLALAVATGRDLPRMGGVWSRLASLDVGALTRESWNGVNSMLDGTYFKNSIDGLFQRLYDVDFRSLQQIEADHEQPPPLLPVVEPEDCTLLVTATALNSPVLTRPLRARDGRRVYRFRYRRARPSQPEADAIPSIAELDEFADGLRLATAARASASFPIAFDPVLETASLRALDIIDPQDAAAPLTSEPQWLADGGVLDNAPFGPLLDAIRATPVCAPYRRALLYVTPGVGELADGPQTSPGDDSYAALPVPGLQTLLGWLVSAIREPDERLDRDSLIGLFHDMSYAESRPERIVLLALGPDPTRSWHDRTAHFVTAAAELFERYQAARGEAFERWLVQLEPGASPPLDPPDPVSLPLEEIAAVPQRFELAGGSGWGWGTGSADRILRWWGRALNAMPASVQDSLLTAFGLLDRAQLVVEQHLTAVTTLVDVPGDLSARAKIYQDYMRVGEPGPSHQIADVMGEVATAIVGALDLDALGVSSTDFVQFGLAMEVVTCTLGWSAPDGDTPLLRFTPITPDPGSPPPFPLLPVPDPRSADDGVIDEERWPALKLYGERWNHFGAFSSPSNRQHDWLWGRIDGSVQLCRELCLATGVAKATRVRFEAQLFAAILEEENTDIRAVQRGAARAMAADARTLYRDLIGTAEGRESIKHLKNAGLVLSDKFLPGKQQWMRTAAIAAVSGSWSGLAPPGAPFRSRVGRAGASLVGRGVRGGLRVWSWLKRPFRSE